ncbi:MAG: outer membrane lipoprotein carrier protein LolA [Thermodesulforhabdaceae bacterium]
MNRKRLCKSTTSWLFTILVAIGILITGSGKILSAENANLKEAISLVKAIEQKYHSANFFYADFIQQIYPPNVTAPSAEATGRFSFAKPCLMRWEYHSPEEQVVVTYPAIGWLYAVKDREVQVFDTGSLYKSVVAKAFLKSILESFEVVDWSRSESDPESFIVVLKPKVNDAQIAKVELVIHKPDATLTRIIGEDQAGTRNMLIFTNQKWEGSFSQKEFMPNFPQDVSISNEQGETISYDKFMKLFEEKKGVLDCSHESVIKK